MILLLDNYDSFVFNLARYIERLGQTTHVVRSDRIDAAGVAALAPAAVVLSPGPCTPNEAGCSLEVVRELAGRLPILGVCLGHQAIGARSGAGGAGPRADARPPSRVFHAGRGCFAGLPSPIVAARYHSLIVERESLGNELEVTAWTSDGTVMAIEHRRWPVVGLQFHPESILTDVGYDLLAAFLRRAGLEPPGHLPTIASERAAPPPPAPLPNSPVTF